MYDAPLTSVDITIENKALLLDLLEWIDAKPRTYAETMDAWRTSCPRLPIWGTSCPRLPIWEDAVDHGFVTRAFAADARAMVRLTPAGREFARTTRVIP